MSFLDKIKPFANVALSLVPGVAPFLPAINAVLTAAGSPPITDKTTGQEVMAAYQAADPDTQKRLDEITLAEIKSYTDIAIAQENNQASTRPTVVLKMADLFIQYAYASFIFLSLAMTLDATLVFNEQEAFIFKIAMEGMPWLAGVYALPAMSIIQDYFARRSDDKRTAMAGIGVQVHQSNSSSLIDKISGIWRKR